MNDKMRPSARECRTLRVLGISVSARDRRFFRLRLSSPGWSWDPGQFVMLRPHKWSHDPFGPRPFSIADQDGESLCIYVQITGKGTEMLSRLCPGDEVLAWGPLGRGFTVEPELPTLLLAGGMGIAPFVGLVRHHPRPQNVEILFGHRHDIANYPFEEMSRIVLSWSIQDQTQEDLEKLKRAVQVKVDGYAGDGRIFACGPLPFLRMVQNICTGCRGRCQLSLEKPMACGVGACLGCVVKSSGGEHLQACLHGPVFEAADIEL
jgi:dihydroorotate dehydrogenase electron transfer subunit